MLAYFYCTINIEYICWLLGLINRCHPQKYTCLFHNYIYLTISYLSAFPKKVKVKWMQRMGLQDKLDLWHRINSKWMPQETVALNWGSCKPHPWAPTFLPGLLLCSEVEASGDSSSSLLITAQREKNSLESQDGAKEPMDRKPHNEKLS